MIKNNNYNDDLTCLLGKFEETICVWCVCVCVCVWYEAGSRGRENLGKGREEQGSSVSRASWGGRQLGGIKCCCLEGDEAVERARDQCQGALLRSWTLD